MRGRSSYRKKLAEGFSRMAVDPAVANAVRRAARKEDLPLSRFLARCVQAYVDSFDPDWTAEDVGLPLDTDEVAGDHEPSIEEVEVEEVEAVKPTFEPWLPHAWHLARWSALTRFEQDGDADHLAWFDDADDPDGTQPLCNIVGHPVDVDGCGTCSPCLLSTRNRPRTLELTYLHVMMAAGRDTPEALKPAAIAALVQAFDAEVEFARLHPSDDRSMTPIECGYDHIASKMYGYAFDDDIEEPGPFQFAAMASVRTAHGPASSPHEVVRSVTKILEQVGLQRAS